LNALPLLEPLQRKSRQAGYEMAVDVPSLTAEELMSGRLDLAMIPSIEYLKAGDSLSLLPGICIASRGAVWTVLLISKTPLAEVRSLAMDNRSRTSVALLRILFADRFHPEVKYQPAMPDIAEMLNTHDAALIIGDPALSVPDCGRGTSIYDLSQEWFNLTGNTFVHALVAVRPGVSLTPEILEAISSARQEAEGEIAQIAKNHAEKFGVSPSICEDYLRNRIQYDLNEDGLRGLTVFRDLCHDRGLIPKKHNIQFIYPR
ncbi:MAG: hypothetical protein A3K09_00985, partial [Nitrospinae bacterium RIFCSPLOWO2_12_FULL_47_7]